MSPDRRKDTRTLKQFAKDIKKFTTRERLLVELFANEYRHRGHNVIILDNGVDNTGKLVQKSNSNADYELIIDGVPGLYEIKCGPVPYKATFKAHDLEAYVKQGANMLLFLGTGYNTKKINMDETVWCIVTPQTMQRMLDENTIYKEKAFGGKPCVQVMQGHFKKYFQFERLEHVGSTN